MSREIKFRAWHKEDNEMVEVAQLEFEHVDMTVSAGGCWHDPHTMYEVMQYTGLKDKNGKEIYEGDIFQYKLGYSDTDPLQGLLHGVVTYDNQRCCYTGGSVGEKANPLFNINETKIEVIGNIYENPELLGVKT